MADPMELEEAILNIITGVRVDDWVPFTMGQLRNRLHDVKVSLGMSSEVEVVDCICSLEAESLVVARKYNGGSGVPFARSQSAEDQYRHQFFWIGSFEPKITHAGRKAIAQKVNEAKGVGNIGRAA